MLYTVVSFDDIFYAPVQMKVQSHKLGNHCFVDVSGGNVLCVHSTDPKDYLRFSPGSHYSRQG